jgi:hypothetical protein
LAGWSNKTGYPTSHLKTLPDQKYGCHEHTRSEIQLKHQEEGVAEIEYCVKCHRSSEKKEHERGNEEREEIEGMK